MAGSEAQPSKVPAPAGHADPHENPYLAHHFETPRQQFESGKLGMWIFLATEVLLFSGLFCAYAVYRASHPDIFVTGHKFLNVWLGGINTIILICSSLSMAWAVRASQLGQQRLLAICLVLTLLGGAGFLGIKYVEYKNKWEEGMLWAGKYKPSAEAIEHMQGDHHGQVAEPAPAATQPGEPAAAAPAATTAPAPQVIAGVKVEQSQITPAPPGPQGLRLEQRAGVLHLVPDRVPRQLWIFFSIYFLMTGLHALHVIGGLGAISWVLARSLKGQFGPAYYTPVDLVGLYWHLVDVIWIFLFPLLYLIH